MMMAVFAQYWLLPIALTMEATHEGPVPSLLSAWSDCAPSGMIQLTCWSWPLAMSSRTFHSGMLTLFTQSGPVQVSVLLTVCGWQIWLMASGAVQMEPAEGA